jgi:lipopolysaccharide/colanic/teichoic acid biosynthesis glycosyltransferase
VLDIAFTLLLSPLLCAIFVVVALLIRLDSRGPIFYRQKRLGREGREFVMLKFRSMYDRCDDAPHREAIERYIANRALSDEEDELAYKLTVDPRITHIGGFLRKSSIDELPQFINVLRGEMSLVGPRPPLPYEVALYSSYDRLRLSGKPGVTGVWQIYGRSRVPFSTMVEMDIGYLKRQSLLQDLKLIALTIPVVLKGQGGA